MASAIASAKNYRGCGCPGSGHRDDCCHAWRTDRKHSYTAANIDSVYTGDWPEYRSADVAYEGEREDLNANILDLYRNYGPARGLVDLTVQHLAASFTPTPTPSLKNLDGWDNEDADEWKSNLLCWHHDWLDGTPYIDAAEKNNFTGLHKLHVRMCKIYGETTGTFRFLDGRQNRFKHRRFATAVQLFNPGRIYTPWDYQEPESRSANRVVDGIEKTFAGRAVAAYVHDRLRNECGYFGFEDKPVRIPAYGRGDFSHRQILIHLFQCLDVDQCRGVSDFATTAEAMQMQRQLRREVVLRAQRQNKSTGVFKSSAQKQAGSVAPDLGLNTPDPDGQEWQTPELSKYSKCSPAFKSWMMRKHHHKNNNSNEAIPGVYDLHLFTDEDYQQIAHDNSTLAINEVMRDLNALSASGHSVTTNHFERDYTVGTYTGQRAGRLDFNAAIAEKKLLSDEFANSIWRTAGEEAVRIGLLRLPERIERVFGLDTGEARQNYYIQNMRPLMMAAWARPAEKVIDPEKDAKGHGNLIDRGLCAESESVAELKGRDYDKHLEMIATDKKKKIQMQVDCEIFEHELRQQNSARLPAPEQVDSDD